MPIAIDLRLKTFALTNGLLASLLLVGCATPPPPPPKALSYVTLLRSPDGSVGKVIVHGSQGEQMLSEEKTAALLDGSKAPEAVDEARLQRDFGEAMAARPVLPEHFVLYFESGGTRLTTESQKLVQNVLDSVAQRPTVDVSVIGHSDTVGKAETNETLSLKRAQLVADLLMGRGLQVEHLSVESHGKRNLLVPTPDETPEPRNRRVEVTVR